MSQHQLFLLFTSCLCSLPSLIALLLVFFLSFPSPQPAQPFDFLCGPLCSLLTVSLSLESGLARPFRHHCPRAFGMRPPYSAARPRLFAMGPTCRYRRTQPLPKHFRHSVLGLLGSPLEVRPVGLLVLLLLPVSIPLGHSMNLPGPSSPLLRGTGSTPLNLGTRAPRCCLIPHVVPVVPC